MDLIYSAPDKTEIGVLKDYEFDLAYGADENDFTLQLALKNHCCQDDYLTYMIDTQNGFEEGTEYGGIIDDIAVDTEDGTVTYSGRTWQGVLSEKVISPESNQDYKIVTGDAHEIINDLLDDLDLSDMFTVADGVSDIQIPSYTFDRYIDAYRGICRMLAENGGKLKMVYDNTQKKVVISAIWLVDYSQRDEWDSSQVQFKIKKRVNPVNHLICLGQGDLKDRAVIHLFTDDNGGIQPYTLTENPVQDSDYILDKRNQVLFGTAEVAEAYDYPSAGIASNYVRMATQPDDWSWNFTSYYRQEDDSFTALDYVEQTGLTILTSQPTDWSTKYGNYYTANGKSVEGVQTENYVRITSKPSDWDKSYGDYYVHFWDGTQYEWRSVNGVSWDEYIAQTQKPSDWDTNFSSYYQHKVETVTVKDKNGKEVKDKDGKTKKTKKIGKGYETVKKVKKGKSEVVPAWKKGSFFTKYTHQKAPKFESGLDKYRLDKSVVAPTWSANTYYTMTTSMVKPPWKANVYYELVYDRYAELVKHGIEKLREYGEEGDSIEIDLNLLGEYDVGDIVGAAEQTTGIEVWQPVTKKIVSITRRGRRISYRIGEVEIL